jgi:hypothetical protein
MAGRKDKNTVDYFPHYVNHGKTLFILESKYSSDGYAAWFKLLEILGKSENHFIDCRKDEDWEYLSAKIKLIHTDLREIVDLCARLGAIDSLLWGNKIIWSENFTKNIQDAYKRRNSDCLQYSDLCNLFDIDVNINSKDVSKNTQSKVKESKVNKRKVRDDVSLSDDEYKKLIDSYGIEFVDKCLDKLNNYKGASGKKYKSDYKAILSWVVDEINKGIKNGTNTKNSPRGSIDFDKYAAEREASKPRSTGLVSTTVPKQLQ